MHTVEFKFGGIERRVKTPLGLALTIEAATGIGIMALAAQLARGEAPLVHALTTIRCALENSGVHYTQDEMLAQLEQHGGIGDTMLAAANIVNGFFVKTRTSRGKSEGNGAKPTGAATTSP